MSAIPFWDRVIERDGKLVLKNENRRKSNVAVIVKMEQVGKNWIVYDTKGQIADENGVYIDRIGQLNNFIHNNFVRHDNQFIPIVFAINNRRVTQYLNELEFEKYFKNVKLNME